MTTRENKIKWILIIAVVLLAGSYLYLFNTSIFSVASRRDNEEVISQLEAEVSSLEAVYAGQLSNINLDLAKKLGFVDSTGYASFAVKDRPIGLLINNNES